MFEDTCAGLLGARPARRRCDTAARDVLVLDAADVMLTIASGSNGTSRMPRQPAHRVFEDPRYRALG